MAQPGAVVSRPGSKGSASSKRSQKAPSVPPLTPLSAGVEAPPHSMSPGDGGQNFQQLHGLLGGATRVVMLRGDLDVRPAIGFAGQMLRDGDDGEGLGEEAEDEADL